MFLVMWWRERGLHQDIDKKNFIILQMMTQLDECGITTTISHDQNQVRFIEQDTY